MTITSFKVFNFFRVAKNFFLIF